MSSFTTNEIQNPSSAPPAQEQASAAASTPVPTAGQDQFGIGFHKVFGEAAKYTLFAIFTLYSIGFIIWHSYLASYGVSSVEFLQAEYLAAAFCYLFIVATFAVPPFLLIEALMRNIKDKGVRRIKEWDKTWLLVVFIWSFLGSKVLAVFLPSSQPTNRGWHILEIILGIAAFHLLACIIFGINVAIKSGNMRAFFFGNDNKKPETSYQWRNSRFYKIAVNSEYIYLYMLVIMLLTLFSNYEVNGEFLFSTMFLYIIVMGTISGTLFGGTWKTYSVTMRTLIVVASYLILISNIQLFAISQFGKITKSVGGGKPETAYFKFSPQYSDVSAALNIPTATSAGLPNGFVGPIGVLLRSEKEILFINYADANAPEYVTNDVVVSIVTNYVTVQMTNPVVYPIGGHETKATNQFVNSPRTNIVYNVSKNIFKNPAKLTARQVKSDLVDSIIFTR